VNILLLPSASAQNFCFDSLIAAEVADLALSLINLR